MGNASIEDMEEHRTVLAAAYDVLIGVAGFQAAAFASIGVLALVLCVVVRANCPKLSMSLASVFLSFFLWPILAEIFYHYRTPGKFPVISGLSLNTFDLVILVNQFAMAIPLLFVPIWLSVRYVAKRRPAAAYLMVCSLLPLAWLLDCFSRGPM